MKHYAAVCIPLPVSYTHLRAHETRHDIVCRLLLEKKNTFEVISWAENTPRGVRFLLRFSMYLFLARCEQVYLFLELLALFLPGIVEYW